MNLYINAYKVAFKSDKSEVVLKLYQESPIMDGDGNVTSVESELISSIVMHSETAQALSATLSKNQEPEE